MHKIIASSLITFFIFSCLAMEKQTQQEIGVDFTAILPQEIQKQIICYMIDSDDIKNTLRVLANSRVNKSFNGIVQSIRKNQFSHLEALTTFFNTTPLIIARHLNNLGMKPKFLHSSANESFGTNNLLLERIREYHLDKVITLIKKENANVDYQDNCSLTPLMWAAMRDGKKIAHVLIEAGADVNLKDNCGNTALIWSIQIEGRDAISQLLIEAGTKINDQNNGSTALMTACLFGRCNTVQSLITAGADKTIKNKRGETAYDIAIQCGYEKIVKLLKP